MANEKNLKPLNKRAKSEQREIQSKGGKASGESRRKRKSLKDLMEIVLECEPDGRTMNAMLRKGIGNEDLTMATAITIALAKEAANGNVAAFKELRDLIGEAGDQADENALAKAREILGGVDSAL